MPNVSIDEKYSLSQHNSFQKLLEEINKIIVVFEI